MAVPAAHDPLARLELALLQIIMSRSPLRATMPPEPVPVSSKPKVEAKTAKTTEPVPTKPVADKKPSPEPITKSELPTAPAPKPAVQVMTVADDAIWNTALNNLKKTHNTLYSIARMAGVSLADDELTLTFGFAFHQKRMSETKNKQVITDIVQQASGRPITIVCLVGEVVKPTATKALTVDPPMAATVSGDALSTISNIFGSAEVLES